MQSLNVCKCFSTYVWEKKLVFTGSCWRWNNENKDTTREHQIIQTTTTSIYSCNCLEKRTTLWQFFFFQSTSLRLLSHSLANNTLNTARSSLHFTWTASKFDSATVSYIDNQTAKRSCKLLLLSLYLALHSPSVRAIWNPCTQHGMQLLF